jgi:hypothetical protein
MYHIQLTHQTLNWDISECEFVPQIICHLSYCVPSSFKDEIEIGNSLILSKIGWVVRILWLKYIDMNYW